MKYFIKLAKDRNKLESSDFIPGGVALGGAALGLKGASDVDKLHKNLAKWEASLAPYREIANKRSLTLGEASEAIDKYIEGGRRVGTTKVLGIPGASYMQKFREATELVPARLSGIPHKIHSAQKSVEHYDYFKNHKKTKGQTLSHFIEKGINAPDIVNEYNTVGEAPRKIIYDNKLSIQERHQKLLSEGFKNEASIFRKSLVGDKAVNSRVLGEAVRLSGNAAGVVSTPELYTRTIKQGSDPLKKGFRTGSKVLGGAGAALIALPLYKEYKRQKELSKSAARKKREEYKNIPEASDAIASTALAAGGTAVAAKGSKHFMSPNKNIGVTYGEMSAIGAGHKAPADALIAVMKEDKRFKNINIERLARDEHGIFRGPYKKYNTIIDTGLGKNIDWHTPDINQTIITHGYQLPKNTKQYSELKYMTDLPKPGTGAGGSTLQRGKKILAYGGEDTAKHLKDDLGMKPIIVGKGLTPAIPKSIVEGNLRGVTREATIKELSQFTDKPLKFNPNKKLITIAGAGRGDYVGIRAKEIDDILTARNLHHKYDVVALQAGAYGDDLNKKLLKNTKVVSVGKLPRQLYNDIQGVSDVNWGATGTSGLTEALMHKNVQAIPEEWGFQGKWDDKEHFTSGSIAERQNKAYGKSVRHVQVDQWNAGNIDYARKQPGVLTANKAEHVVDLLEDEKAFTKMQAASVKRSGQQVSNYMEGNKKLVDSIHKHFKSIQRVERAAGAGLVGAGVLAAGIGLKSILKKDNTKK